ncbi:MAG: UPF0104 family protein, partial [Acidobacteriota bacterium]|jgi:hypothetical protein
MVPTPAGVGGFHLAVELALVDLFGIAAGPAASYALVCHAVVFIPITLIGILLLSREGLTLRAIEEEEGDVYPVDEAPSGGRP